METEEDFYNTTVPEDNCMMLFNVFGLSLVTLLVIMTCLAVPLTVLAICALLLVVQKENTAPIYLINLLISDLIQLSCSLFGLICHQIYVPVLHFVSLMANIGFMMCVAVERYLVVAWPVWYRFRRSIKASVLVCVIVWLFPLVLLITFLFTSSNIELTLLIFLLLPFPVLIFSLVGTLKSLSGVSSVSPEEKRRIVLTLVLVLFNYTVLFLPIIICFTLMQTEILNIPLFIVAVFLILISPFADLFLYVLIGKGATEKLIAFLCRCRKDRL